MQNLFSLACYRTKTEKQIIMKIIIKIKVTIITIAKSVSARVVKEVERPYLKKCPNMTYVIYNL